MTPEGAQLQFPEGPAMALPLAQPQNAAPPQGAAVTPEGALLRSPEERAAIVRNLLHGTDGHHPLRLQVPEDGENARWQGRSWWWQGHSWWWQGGWTGRDSSQWTDWQ